MKILVVDDDVELLPLVAFAIRQAGFLALETSTGEEALQVIRRERPDLVILDANLPGIDGFEVCRILREASDRTPVLLLTVRSEEEDLVRGLELGADDYLTKPFSPRTLLARVKALLRRSQIEGTDRLEVGDLELDEELRAVRIAGRPRVRLTHLELRLLQMLAANMGRTVRAEQLLVHVWGAHVKGDRQHLKQLVHRLRRKLEDDPAHPRRVLTVPGLGYRMDPSSSR